MYSITPSLHEIQTGEMLEILTQIHANIKNVTCLQHMDTLCYSVSRICVC